MFERKEAFFKIILYISLGNGQLKLTYS